jgi:RNA polymerase sigma factor (sigma-70 family)
LEASDYELIKTCLSGRQDAFAVIVTRYKKLVYNVIYNCTGGHGEADDLSQEVFLRVYRSLNRFNPDYRFATWVIKIATNVCLDWLHRNKNEPAPAEALTGVRDNRSNPEEQYMQYMEHEELGRIRKAMRELPEKYRIPVVLFHQQGLSYKELEEILNQPETIIKNRLYRARLMMKEKLCPEREKR